MTDILLVRHGQASFGSENYDRLSDLGRRQADVLGTFWEKIGWRMDAAVSGLMSRQLDTAQLALGGRGEIHRDEAFNEYDSAALLRVYGQAPASERERLDPHRFQQRLEQALRGWIADREGRAQAEGIESWSQFNQRVRLGLERQVAGAAFNHRRAVFTSAGAIACALAQVMELDGEGFIALNRRVLNASVSLLGYGRSGFSLQGFNDVSALRLTDHGLVTYR